MATAREFTRHAFEALDHDRPEAARALADLALVHIRLGLRPEHVAPDITVEPPADLPQPRSTAQDPNLLDLPAECGPGRPPELLTDAQAHARILYGLTQDWTQRRIGKFAGRSATTVNKVKSSMESKLPQT
ncbi:hypothetical protein [Streptomyces amakusaensis]|uniref:Uncharacterized protein n=1 Tax=Streptomyces amakusaensis TaxID=67271 RepID=A0ABW0AW31_9ACTN